MCGHTLCNVQTTRISCIGSLFLATLCTAVFHCMDSCFTLSVQLCLTLWTAVLHCMGGCISLLVYSCASLYVQLRFIVWTAVFHSMHICTAVFHFMQVCTTVALNVNVHSCVSLNCTAMFHCIYHICTSLFANRISQLRVSPS